ncbi:ABATE domain-containing protein [Spirillospora sp. NPDC127506]|jgi:predicted RNA-binding Zn ribbon-like protein|uniref:CGNR zinc finger domain-containing protein n=1 Tax=Actinomadura sp. TaxID=1989 RepID=UPI003347AB89
MTDPVPLTGEPLALDLVNTRPAGADLLSTVDALAAWLALEGERVPQPETLTAADLPPVHAVRDCAAIAIGHARRAGRPPEDALAGLTEAQRRAPAVKRLGWDGTAVTATPERTGRYGVRLAAHLAEAVADLLADPAVGRVRECEADGCVMLFLPAHPRRRWCSAARCGNRARVARYYARRK